MKVIDIIFALVCGRAVAWIAVDFFKEYGIDPGLYRWLLYFGLPFAAVACLWLAQITSNKFLFVYQAVKFILVGAFATIIDIKLFQLLAWFFSIFALVYPLVFKAVSFMTATLAKYWGNKHWVFGKNEKDGLKKELLQFFIVTSVGVIIDVCAFYYFIKILGPQFSAPVKVWQEISIILAALAAAACNFLGYKFIVFKK